MYKLVALKIEEERRALQRRQSEQEIADMVHGFVHYCTYDKYMQNTMLGSINFV